MDPKLIGYLQGVLAHVSLVADAEVIAYETRSAMLTQLRPVKLHMHAWTRLVEEVVKGTRDAKNTAIVGAVFRPNYHAKKADDHLASERWTEATLRYVQAGETLLRDVISSALEEKLGAELSQRERTTHWRTTAQTLLTQAGFDPEGDPAWREFSEVYRQRNTRFAHGHEEASIEDAVRARNAWTAILELMRSAFASTTGTTLEDLQLEAVQSGAEVMSNEESEALIESIRQAQFTSGGGAQRLSRLVQDHRLLQPKEIGDLYAQLSLDDREIADAAFIGASREAFERIKHVWSTTTDLDSVLVEATFDVATGEQHDAAVRALRFSVE